MNKFFTFFKQRTNGDILTSNESVPVESKKTKISQLLTRITRSYSRRHGVPDGHQGDYSAGEPPRKKRNKVKPSCSAKPKLVIVPPFVVEDLWECHESKTETGTRRDVDEKLESQFVATADKSSVQVHHGSATSTSLALDSQTCSFALLSPKSNFLQLHDSTDRLKSPLLATISARTPDQSATFYKQVAKVAESRHRVLGKGSFGTIVHATYKGELVAAKIVSATKSNSLRNELNNFLLHHSKIVQTLRIMYNDDIQSCGLVIMEMCSPFNLEHLLEEDSYPLDERTAIRFMSDISEALIYCHANRVLHLDVKPQNFLVNTSTNTCKLCDFGSSCLLPGDDMDLEDPLARPRGTVVYMAPELLAGEFPTVKSDVYSFGITLWQIIYKEKPYVENYKIDLQSTIYKIVKLRQRPQNTPTKKGGVIESLYMSCWSHEPEKRPNMSQVNESLEDFLNQI